MATKKQPENRNQSKSSASAAPRAAKKSDSLAGTQSIRRAVSILKEISSFGKKGIRLVDIANAMQLERPTVHRMMRGLMSQGMVTQDPKTKTYRLGPVVYELGLAATPYHNLREICQPSLQSLANRTGDSIFLVVRSGMDVVCIDNLDGDFIIKARTLDIGVRRPLGVGAGSLALLLQLNEDEAEQVIAANKPRFPLFGTLTEQKLRHAMEQSRKLGYAINDEDVMPGVIALGAPILNSNGTSYAAISIAGISSRMQEPRRDQIARLLLRETRAISRELANHQAY